MTALVARSWYELAGSDMLCSPALARYHVPRTHCVPVGPESVSRLDRERVPMQPLKGMHFFVDILGVPALANGCSGEVVTDLLAQAPAYERQQQAILVFVARPAGSAICLTRPLLA